MVSVLGFFLLFFFTGLLHRSHSPRQFACLSESEKEGLSALTPHRGCASYPNRPLLAFKSRAPTSLSYSTWLSCPLTIAPTPSLPVNTPAFARGGKKGGWGRERENPRYYLMRSWSARVLFTVTRHRGPFSAGEENHWASPSSSSSSSVATTTASTLTTTIIQKPKHPDKVLLLVRTQQQLHQDSVDLKVIFSTITACYITRDQTTL